MTVVGNAGFNAYEIMFMLALIFNTLWPTDGPHLIYLSLYLNCAFHRAIKHIMWVCICVPERTRVCFPSECVVSPTNQQPVCGIK